MRSKLAAVLIIPSVAFLVLAGAQTVALVGQTGTLSEFTRQVEIGREITALIHELQRERDRTAGELAGGARSPGGGHGPAAIEAALRPVHTRTDAAVDRLRDAAAERINADAAWRVSYARVDEGLKRLPDIRAAVPVTGLNADTVLGGYHRLIDALLSLLAEPSPGPNEPELTDAVLRYVQFARVKETSSQIRAKLYAAARAGRYGVDDLVALSELRARQLTAFADFRVTATAEQIQRYEQTSIGADFLAATRLEESTIVSGANQPAVLEPDQWWNASERRQELFQQLEKSILGDAIRLAETRSAGQLRQTLLTATAILAVLLAALLTSMIIGRSIARSLRQLRNQALRVAQVELPEALEQLRSLNAQPASIEIPPAVVRSMDEIGEVAEAFVAVHRSAVQLAAEQATMRRNVNAMFVNLARRSQVLVERQLELLDELERDESDPDQLENLFKLDHLATRMRRNDDSLLVLAGTESSRRWSRPVPLSAVMLAAAAEIEQYQRVRHWSQDQLHVVGHAVADLVHLLAELLENATAFSRPDTSVEVTARAEAGTAVIEIIDTGLGMSESALAEANELLEVPPAVDVGASERMGLFVVSHLAARQGIQVRLRAGEPGVIAVVRLPASILAANVPQGAELPASRRVMAALAAGPTVGRASVPGASQPPKDGPGPAPVIRHSTVHRSNRRAMPTRAEDVLAPAADAGSTTVSIWWSRPDRVVVNHAGKTDQSSSQSAGQSGDRADRARPEGSGQAGPAPAQRATGGVGRGGLPIRVPMAQLPGVSRPAGPAPAPPRHDPDPEAVGGMLSRFYNGVRRAEAEDTIDATMPPGGARSGREHK